MPTERIVLKPGRNALFMMRMRGRYGVKLEEKMKSPSESRFRVEGYIKTDKSVNRITGKASDETVSGERCFYAFFECEDYFEHVEVVLDVAWPTNCAHEVSAVVFPCK